MCRDSCEPAQNLMSSGCTYVPFVLYNRCMKRTNIYIPTPMLEKLQSLAQQRDVSVAELIRRAVEEYLKKQT